MSVHRAMQPADAFIVSQCGAKHIADFVGVLPGLLWLRGDVWFCRAKGHGVYKPPLSGSVKEYPISRRIGVKLIQVIVWNGIKGHEIQWPISNSSIIPNVRRRAKYPAV
jgi:hypothetical protein